MSSSEGIASGETIRSSKSSSISLCSSKIKSFLSDSCYAPVSKDIGAIFSVNGLFHREVCFVGIMHRGRHISSEVIPPEPAFSGALCF